ncbi:MAG TPA: S9 family peptidase [Steroidobacteraceae bacterium]|jgi:oligopeptidase B
MTFRPRPGVVAAPAAHRTPVTIQQLGRERTDDYAWMKAANWRAALADPTLLAPEIANHLRAENRHAADVLAPTGDLQQRLIREMRARMHDAERLPAMPDGPWHYYQRYLAGAQHPVYAREPRGGGTEEVLFDANALASAGAFLRIHTAAHSPDHEFFAYSADLHGNEDHLLRVVQLRGASSLQLGGGRASGAFAFSADSKWLYWVRRDENGRPTTVLRDRIPPQPGGGEIVYSEPDPTLSVSLKRTRSGAYIAIVSENRETSETRVLRASGSCPAPSLIEPRAPGVLYDVEHWAGRFVILTNADGAADGKVMWADELAPARKNWKELVAHRTGHLITKLVPYRDHLARIEWIRANPRIVITERATLAEHTVDVEEIDPAYAIAIDPGFEYETDTLRYIYQSPVAPRSWWNYHMSSRRGACVFRDEVPEYDPTNYVVQRIEAVVDDGARVPVTVLTRRSTKRDGSSPIFLFGYGAYGVSVETVFSPAIFSLIDRGWVYAIAHIRGGSELGREWFLAGRGMRKRNTFTDFIACAERLCEAGYGSPGRIVAYGRSAGGMLAGAVLNERPDLWAGVIAGAPFVDVLNTMCDPSLPLTPPEWPEWGNPLLDATAYDYIASYSPYENVMSQPYPPVLVTAGVSDPRVTYWEPMKWVAKLRECNTADSCILLNMNMAAGHTGAGGKFGALGETALHYAFAIHSIG